MGGDHDSPAAQAVDALKMEHDLTTKEWKILYNDDEFMNFRPGRERFVESNVRHMRRFKPEKWDPKHLFSGMYDRDPGVSTHVQQALTFAMFEQCHEVIDAVSNRMEEEATNAITEQPGLDELR